MILGTSMILASAISVEMNFGNPYEYSYVRERPVTSYVVERERPVYYHPSSRCRIVELVGRKKYVHRYYPCRHDRYGYKGYQPQKSYELRF